jgi:threonine dehydrogenase-like Zn-dependent dehydrogenase
MAGFERQSPACKTGEENLCSWPDWHGSPSRFIEGSRIPGKNSYDAVVIGAGHNGLTAAAYLAGAGLSTLVLERSE